MCLFVMCLFVKCVSIMKCVYEVCDGGVYGLYMKYVCVCIYEKCVCVGKIEGTDCQYSYKPAYMHTCIF